MNHHNDEDFDRELKEELNRKYKGKEGFEHEEDSSGWYRTRRYFIAAAAFVLALVFLFTVTGRWLSVFAGPAFIFLRESWALSDDPLVEELRSSIVQVHVDRRSGVPRGQIRGTGFNLAPDGLVVTNRHLVEDANSVRVSFPNAGTFSAQHWTVYPYADLAILDLDAEDLPAVSISDLPAYADQEVLVIGNPLQFTRIANKGMVVGYRENRSSDIPFLVVEALIYPGSSGSPVFNEHGEVVGVIFATLRNSDPSEVRGLAVSAAELRLFLEAINRDQKTSAAIGARP